MREVVVAADEAATLSGECCLGGGTGDYAEQVEGAGGVNRDLAIIYSISEDKTESNERDENPFGRVSKDY